ncbi:uncharacterized protein EDB93DRAFT_1117407 [Suillus bovinus]|uniref:uncharacterized protein n=1 Tax=Suillus bovinus TaxID=48563 RepID=UPI001B87E45A|nr:uncharacterized protein EDB93DRAFT_1117407 [Suillus bovinus]KAG2158994.1 hypothetical protein EDB93DRAFT_1117407 [Suillus bovinus]
MPLIPTYPSSWSPDTYRIFNYFVVASSATVVYDWVLTIGREYELIWRQRRSLMTALYIIVLNLPGVFTTDMVSFAMDLVLLWTILPVNVMLSVIMISRLYAMYQRSRKILILLIASLIFSTVFCSVIAVAGTGLLSIKVILYGTQCVYEIDETQQIRMLKAYALATAWEVLTLGLAIWAVVKHLRELRRQSPGWNIIGDCFAVLLKTHVLYFVFFAASSSLNIGLMSPRFSASTSLGAQIYRGYLEFATLLQMFVTGPRLILSIREYNAELTSSFEDGDSIHPMAFQEYIPESTDSDM